MPHDSNVSTTQESPYDIRFSRVVKTPEYASGSEGSVRLRSAKNAVWMHRINQYGAGPSITNTALTRGSIVAIIESSASEERWFQSRVWALAPARFMDRRCRR